MIDKAGLGCPKDRVAALVEAVLHAEGAQGTALIVFVDEPAIAELNGRYRGLNEPTDVLSFSYVDDGADRPGGLFPESPVENGPVNGVVLGDLGEVVVCPAIVRRYAAEDGCEAGRQVGWTIVHGVLHLLGYDHERDEDEMRGREQALLGELDNLVRALSPSANV